MREEATVAVRKRTRALVGVGGAAALGLAAYLGYGQLVKLGVFKYNQYDRRERGRLKVGDAAPDLALATYSGGTVRLSELWREKPVVLVFGSCT